MNRMESVFHLTVPVSDGHQNISKILLQGLKVWLSVEYLPSTCKALSPIPSILSQNYFRY